MFKEFLPVKAFPVLVSSLKEWSINLKLCLAADPVQRWSSCEEGPRFLKALNPLQIKYGYGFIQLTGFVRSPFPCDQAEILLPCIPCDVKWLKGMEEPSLLGRWSCEAIWVGRCSGRRACVVYIWKETPGKHVGCDPGTERKTWTSRPRKICFCSPILRQDQLCWNHLFILLLMQSG